MAVGANQRDKKYIWAYLLGAVVLTFVPWILLVPRFFIIPKGQAVKGYYYSLLATPYYPFLLFVLSSSAIAAAALMIWLYRYNKTNFEGADYHRRLRGAQMCSPEKLRRMTKERQCQFRFVSIPVPNRIEGFHFSVAGSTGQGKTVAIADFMASVQERERGDRLIITDPNGGFMRHFWQEGDVILNPFDARGQGWSIFNEIRSRYDAEQFAVSMIPKSPSTEQEPFNAMARVLVAEVLIRLWETGAGTNANLQQWLINADKDTLAEFLQNTPAAGLFEASETYGSIKSVLTQYVKPHKYLTEGTFSIRDWLDNKHGHGGNLWITWRQDMLAALKPLISCWVDTTCAALLSTDDRSWRSFVTVFDELDSLSKLNYIIDAVTKGRKHGLRAIVGFQSLSQLDETYGQNDAKTLRNCFSSFAVCSVTAQDTYTPKEYSTAFGQHEVTRYQNPRTFSGFTDKVTRQLMKEQESIITPEQISGLPPLTFYVRLSGNYPVAKVKMKYTAYATVTDGFVLIQNKWTAPAPRT